MYNVAASLEVRLEGTLPPRDPVVVPDEEEVAAGLVLVESKQFC